MKESILAGLVIFLFVIAVVSVGIMQKEDLKECEDSGYSESRCLELVAR